MNILETTKNFCEEMNKTNSILDKKQVLKKYPEMKEMLEWIYNPFKQFYVTSDNCKKNSILRSGSLKYNGIYTLLTALEKRVITGHDAIKAVNYFIDTNRQYKEVIYNIIDKDLKCRIGEKIINDVYPNLIPTFEVALANKYQDYKGDLFDGSFYASRKMDGCRVITIIDENGDAKFFSRQGKEFETLEVLKEAFKKLNLKNTVFDGEVCVVDENGNEEFQSIMKMIRKKDFTIPNPKYLIFDHLTVEEFKEGKSEYDLLKRLLRFHDISGFFQSKYFDLLDQTKINSEDQLTEHMNVARKNKWEGLILRKNAPYKSGRSNDLLKVKDMQDTELKVIDVEFGPFRIIDKETKKEVTVETLSAVIVKYKDYEVRVGSGFSLEERDEFFKDPSKIKGHMITVNYFAETTDKTGKLSLRFPVYKGIRDIKE